MINSPVAMGSAALLLSFQSVLAQDVQRPATAAETADVVSQGQLPESLVNKIDPSKAVVLRFELRAGGQIKPDYFGASTNREGPNLGFKFEYGQIRGLGKAGRIEGERVSVLGVRGSLRYIRERSADDFSELRGLEDVEDALEIGFGVVYRQPKFEVYGEMRYGVMGHQAVTGEIGADYIAFPNDRWTLRIGPRMSFGDDKFTDTYFGVSESEAAASQFNAYSANGGLLSAGLEATATYRINDLWGIEASVRGDRLLNAAADSPITQSGSEDQLRVRIGVTREFLLQF